MGGTSRALVQGRLGQSGRAAEGLAQPGDAHGGSLARCGFRNADRQGDRTGAGGRWRGAALLPRPHPGAAPLPAGRTRPAAARYPERPRARDRRGRPGNGGRRHHLGAGGASRPHRRCGAARGRGPRRRIPGESFLGPPAQPGSAAADARPSPIPIPRDAAAVSGALRRLPPRRFPATLRSPAPGATR